MSVSMVFLFMYVRLAETAVEKQGLFFYQKYSGLGETVTKYTGGIMVIAVAVIINSVKFYVKSRLKDYGMLLVLGIRAKDMRMFLILEYTLSSAFSCAAGILLGQVLSIFLGKGMNALMGQDLTASVSMAEVYQWTLGLCVAMTAAGTYQWPWTYTFILVLVDHGYKPGVCAIHTDTYIYWSVLGAECWDSYLFEVYKKSKRYHKKILVWNQFYHYFNKNKNIMIIQMIMGIFLLNFCWMLLATSFMTQSPNCPQDFICITEDGQQFKTELEQKYQAEVISFPFVIMSLSSQEPRFGIAEAAYPDIFGKDIELKEDEVFSVRTDTSFASLIEDEKIIVPAGCILEEILV